MDLFKYSSVLKERDGKSPAVRKQKGKDSPVGCITRRGGSVVKDTTKRTTVEYPDVKKRKARVDKGEYDYWHADCQDIYWECHEDRRRILGKKMYEEREHLVKGLMAGLGYSRSDLEHSSYNALLGLYNEYRVDQANDLESKDFTETDEEERHGKFLGSMKIVSSVEGDYCSTVTETHDRLALVGGGTIIQTYSVNKKWR